MNEVIIFLSGTILGLAISYLIYFWMIEIRGKK